MKATPTKAPATPALSMPVFPRPNVPGFEVVSDCGRTWFVPLEKIRDDYADFLVQADRISKEEAVAKAVESGDFLKTWFYEQFVWQEVESYGVLIGQPTPERLKEILDFYRNNFSGGPADKCVAHNLLF